MPDRGGPKDLLPGGECWNLVAVKRFEPFCPLILVFGCPLSTSGCGVEAVQAAVGSDNEVGGMRRKLPPDTLTRGVRYSPPSELRAGLEKARVAMSWSCRTHARYEVNAD